MPMNTNIPAEERLIVALDVPSRAAALEIVRQIDKQVVFYKLGLELFMSGEGFGLLDELAALDKKIFVDLKFFDVPQTVAAAVRQFSKYPAVQFTTIHGNDTMLKAAVDAAPSGLKLLAVTALTSLDRGDLDALGFDCSVEDLVVSRAQRACAIGCHGVIASGQEAAAIKAKLDKHLLIITPGIRPVDNCDNDDQKRTVDVATAFANGADYIVVGRPITQAKDPQRAAADISASIPQQL